MINLLFSGGEFGTGLLTSVESLNPTTKEWEAEADLPAEMKLACAVGIEEDNSIIVTGGFGAGAAMVYRYDVAAKTWEELTSMTFGHSDHGCMRYTWQGKTAETSFLPSSFLTFWLS